MIIKSVSQNLSKADFYIARVGLVGKPMLTPFTANNSFLVFSDSPDIDFQRVMFAYKAGLFRPYTIGSVQPSIRIGDVKKVINECVHISNDALVKSAAIEKAIRLQEENLAKSRSLLDKFYRSIVFSAR